MALIADDLIAPVGQLEPDLFEDNDPGGNTLQRVATWLAEAEGKVAALSDPDTHDAAAAAWVYYRAYSAKYQRLLSQPVEERVGKSDRSRVFDQIKAFQRLAEQALAEFQHYTATSAMLPSFFGLASGRRGR